MTTSTSPFDDALVDPVADQRRARRSSARPGARMNSDTRDEPPPPRTQQPQRAPPDLGRVRAGRRRRRLGVESRSTSTHLALRGRRAVLVARRCRRARGGTPRWWRAGRACAPVAATAPSSSMSTTRSASAMVAGRWAMISVVRPRITSVSAARISCSFVGSTADVASSRISTRGSARIARAMARRWRWPPESEKPCSPRMRLVPVGQRADEVVGAGEARRHARPASSVDVAVAARRPRTRGSPRRCR